MTRDIDVALQPETQGIEDFCRAFSSEEFYLSRPAIEEAVALCRPFYAIHLDSGNKVDFMVIDDSSWNVLQLSRRIEVELTDDVTGYVAAPEDVILGKLTYYREGGSDKHLRDIAGILKISSELVNREYLAQHATELQVSDIWQAILETIEAP